MPILRLRLTAGEDDAYRLIDLLSAIDGVESAEEVADLMPHMDDPDSSSAGLSDNAGPGSHAVKVVGERNAIDQALQVAEAAARDMGAALEVTGSGYPWAE